MLHIDSSWGGGGGGRVQCVIILLVKASKWILTKEDTIFIRPLSAKMRKGARNIDQIIKERITLAVLSFTDFRKLILHMTLIQHASISWYKHDHRLKYATIIAKAVYRSTWLCTHLSSITL